MQTFLKEILLNTLHENIPCLPEKALRERERERGERNWKKGRKKKETKYVKDTNQRQFLLINNFTLEYS